MVVNVPSTSVSDPGDSGKLLDIRHLVVSFPIQDKGWINVVNGVSFSITAGETIALVGESGAGKTATSLAIIGLHRPPAARVSGEIIFNDRNLLTMRKHEINSIRGSDIAMVFQEPTARLNPSIRVGEQIAEVLRFHRGLSHRQAAQRAIELLDEVEMAGARERASAYPFEMSGGMCQRVMIAIALACSPKLLIADEPTSSLDVTIQAQVLDLLSRIQAEYHMAILFVTHDLAIAADVCDRAIVMYGGQIIENGSVDTVLRDPHHPYTSGLICAMPQEVSGEPSHGGVRRLIPIPGAAPLPWALPSGCAFHPRCQYMIADRCIHDVPPLVSLEGDRKVRCVRANELDLRGME